MVITKGSSHQRLTFIDLGDSEPVDAWVNHTTGTPVYSPSEIANIKKKGYSLERADIYSLGISILVILFQDLPFTRIDRDQFEKCYNDEKAFAQFFNILYQPFRRGTDETHQLEILRLAFSCINPEPLLRPTISEMMKVAWIAQAPETMDTALQ